MGIGPVFLAVGSEKDYEHCYNKWRQFRWINDELNKYLKVL